MSVSEPFGQAFKLVGLVFNTASSMIGAVQLLTQEAGWKLKMLMRTSWYYDISELVMLYKAHMLSFIEYRNPALYHATRDVSCKLDRVREKFLECEELTQ